MEYQKYQNKTDNFHDYHNNDNKTKNLDDNTNKIVTRKT